MYSLNAPVPSALEDIAEGYAPSLERFDRRPDRLHIVIKRFGRLNLRALDALRADLETVLSGWGPIRARCAGLDVFMAPTGGPAPVVYLTVDSPGLEALHRDLVDRCGTRGEDLEGEGYVPHVTLARGGERTLVDEILADQPEPVTWTIDAVVLWDGRHGESVTRYALPAGS